MAETRAARASISARPDRDDGPTAERETSVHDRLDELAHQITRLEGMASGLYVSTTGEGLDPQPLDQYDRGVMGRVTHALERLSRVIVITDRVCDVLGYDSRDVEVAPR